MGKKKKKTERSAFRRALPIILVFLFLDVVLAVCFYIYMRDLVEMFTSYTFWACVVVLDGSILAFYLMNTTTSASRAVKRGSDLEDTDWLPIKRLKHISEFSVCDFSRLDAQGDGIVIGAKKKRNGDVEIVETSQLHALIVGTTGSGKTTGFVNQNIACLSSAKTRPSLVISDPKKELYQMHAKSLRARGYKVTTLDLRSPYASKKWNPMNVLVRRIRMLKEIENPKYKNGKYHAAGEVFETKADCKIRKQELYDELYENAMDLVYTLCPVKNKDQPSWEEGARNLIFGFVLAMCEDCIAGRISEKQMVLFNVYHNITSYCTDDPQILREYLLDNRDEFSKVKGLVNTVLITSDRTLTSYLSEVNSYMQQLSDDGILSLTSENEIDILHMDDKPSAVFIIVPDERVTRHRFVSLFVTQMYKELVEKANLNYKRKKTSSVTLRRNCYFILDEFGNLPKFEAIDQMVTVGRSRGIRFLFVLQSFSQLAVKYGNEGADVVKSNCNVKIFIGSDDEKTRQEFSELCGQKTISSTSISQSSGEFTTSSSTSATTRPLISTGELERLNGKDKGEAIVSVRGYDPIKTMLTPSFELMGVYCPAGEEKDQEVSSKEFRKADYLFDISGDSEEDYVAAAMQDIEENEREQEEAMGADPDELDERWQEVIDQVDLIKSDLAFLLEPPDAKSLLEADINNVSRILDCLYSQYSSPQQKRIQARIEETIDRLNEDLFPELRKYQNRYKIKNSTEE